MSAGLPDVAYLTWALPRYGQIQFDLATSGLATVAPSTVAEPEELFRGATDPAAVARYAEAVAARYGVDVTEVVPTAGTTHGLFCAYAALLGRGVEALVEAPTYEPLVRIAEGLGARVVPFVRDLERGAEIDLAAIERAITPRTRLIVLSDLHNPTGAALREGDVAAVAAIAAKVSAHVLIDEVYRELVDFDPRSGRTAFGVAPNVLVTSSLTKVYGLSWARAGWVLAPPEIAARARIAVLHSAGALSTALAAAGTIALSRIEELHARSLAARAHDDDAAAILERWVAARPHLSFRRHPGSIYGFVVDRRGIDARPAIERAVVEEQVIVAPGVFFGWPSGFRIRYGAIPLELLEEGLARLGRVFDRIEGA